MRHLRKPAALLVTFLLLAFVVPRFMPTTLALENYGFYPNKTAESTMTWSTQPTQYAATTTCNSCHSERNATWTKSSHASVACETCHGPAATHVAKGIKLTLDSSREACLTCHGQVTARPAGFPQVDPAKHGGQSTCVTCHNPHDPTGKTKAASTSTQPSAPQVQQTVAKSGPPPVPHALEGRAGCLLCHQTGGVKPVPADHAGRTSATCVACHGSK